MSRSSLHSWQASGQRKCAASGLNDAGLVPKAGGLAEDVPSDYYRYRGAAAVRPYKRTVTVLVLAGTRTASPEQLEQIDDSNDAKRLTSTTPDEVELLR